MIDQLPTCENTIMTLTKQLHITKPTSRFLNHFIPCCLYQRLDYAIKWIINCEGNLEHRIGLMSLILLTSSPDFRLIKLRMHAIVYCVRKKQQPQGGLLRSFLLVFGPLYLTPGLKKPYGKIFALHFQIAPNIFDNVKP